MAHEITVSDDSIGSKIYVIRNQKVMLDSDLAALYQVDTKQLKRQVRRNIERFPQDFMFELTREEYEFLRSQFGTLKRGEHSKYLPMVFTEQGVAMLSSVLSSPTAIKVNIQIIRVFAKIREVYADTLQLKLEIEAIKNKLSNQSQNIELVFNYLDELMERNDNTTQRKAIGFKTKED